MNRAVAIIGFAFRLPGASDDRLWDLLREGRDLVTEVPVDRWSKPYFLHPDKSEPGRSYTFAAGTLGDISGFDAGFFGISPREALQMDPQQRLLLEMTWEAFESGGVRPSTVRGSNTAVYVGYSGSDYSYRRADDLSVVDASSMTGNTGSVAANRLSYWFDLHGPSMAVDTACSSSLVAFHQAWQSMQTGEVDQAVVAGISLHLHPMPFVGFSKASMLSPTGRCRVFDADGDGYVRAEGGGVFLLKDLAAAEADGDRIFAVVAGVGSNCDGRTGGLTIPSRDAQADLLRSLYSRAGIKPDDVDYLEAHGTGTAVGDPIEAASIAAVLGAGRDPDNPLLIGSVKSNLGHLETASGVAGLVKALYCLRHREVPASLHLETPNPNIPLDEWNLKVVTESTPLDSGGRLTIGVNSFGFGGANAHVILCSPEDTVDTDATNEGERVRPTPPLLLSAAGVPALRELAARYAALLRSAPDIDTYDLAFNAFYRRELMAHRLLVPADDKGTLIRRLEDYARGEVGQGAVEGEAQQAASPPVFVYSGNGSQWAGMGQVLLAHDEVYRAQVNEVDRLLRAIGGESIIEEIERAPAESRYARTEIAQPALFAIQVGLTAVLRSNKIEPAAVAGHSVGEVAAAWACGALTLEQAVKVIHYRSQAQGRTRGSGGMTAVALSGDAAVELLRELGIEGELTLAGINSPRGVTVAGLPEALTRLEATLDEREVFHRRLALDYAFHSAAMDPVEPLVRDALADLAPAAASGFFSTVTGTVLSGSKLTADYWWRNIREPVLFHDAIVGLAARGHNLFVEIGPHPVLRNYILDALRERGIEGQVVETLARADERVSRLDETIGRVLLAAPRDLWINRFAREARFVDLPRYPWQRESFWPAPSPESHDDLCRVLDHPLLGFRERDNASAWESRLDPRIQRDLADHRVGDSILFPAAGFAELALAAAAQRHPGNAHVVEDLEILAPLVLEGGVSKRVRLRCDEPDGRFEITSNNRLSDEPWAHHAVGRLIATPPRSPEPRAFTPPDRPFDFSADEHYALTERVGLQYGPAYRVVEGVWRDGDRLTCRLGVPAPDHQESDYRLSPRLLDGCFQILADHSAEDVLRGDTDAHVPIRIQELRTWREGVLPVYADGRMVRRSERSAVVDLDLYDANLIPVARLIGVRFRRVRLVHALANRRWLGYRLLPRPRPSPEAGAALPTLQGLVDRYIVDADESDPERVRRLYEEVTPLIDVLCAAYAEQAVRSVSVGTAGFDAQALVAEGRLVAEQLPLFDHLLGLLVDEEALERTEHGVQWVPEAGLPDPEMIWLRLLRDYPEHAAQVLLAGRAGRCLTGVLRGDLDGARLVAGWAEGATLDDYLRGADTLRRIDERVFGLINGLVEDLPASECLRVLLVTDRRLGLSARLLRRIDLDCCEITLARNAERKPALIDELLEGLPAVRSIELSFDERPEQWSLGDLTGLDLVVIDNALSRMADPEAVLRLLRGSLRLGGVVVVSEQQPSAWSDLVLGLVPSWWEAGYHAQPEIGVLPEDDLREGLLAAGFEEPLTVFDETELRQGAYLSFARAPGHGRGVESDADQPDSLLIIHDPSGYSASLAGAVRSGLQSLGRRGLQVACGPEADGTTSFYQIDLSRPDTVVQLFVRLRDSGLVPTGVVWLAGLEPDAPRATEASAWLGRQAERCAAIGRFFKVLSNSALHPACWIVTADAFSAETPGRDDVSVADPSGDSLVWGFGRCLINEFPDTPVRLIDLAAPHQFAAMQTGLLEEIVGPSEDDEVVIGPNGRLVGRVGMVGPDIGGRSGGRARGDLETVLDFDTPGPLSGLRWLARPARPPGPGEVAIDVRAAGLNFRDVMFAMGLLSDEAVEAGFAGATLGMELSGVVTAVGPEVTSVSPGQAVIAFAPASLATRAVTSALAVVAKPVGWSFEAAATVPTTFFTVLYALRELARLGGGERILIHGAAGGVGIAAIQMAQYLGAEIFATAGSPEKRDFVRQLGVTHVFDSRSLDFADEILEQTAGEGIDVVLNSLAGEAIHRNLKVLRPFGRFLELGKRDYYENTRIGLRPFRNNISYFGIDADQLMAERPDLTRRLLRDLFGLFERDDLRPLPFTRFVADDAIDAFRFMQQSKQIGKVVLTFDTPPKPQVFRLPRDRSLELDPRGSYLVTGGMSGFGAATAHWLVSKGARYLALLSRRGEEAPGAAALTQALSDAGAEVRVFACDVADGSALAEVFAEIEASLPPLRGLIHAAMVIDDGLISDLDASRINGVLSPKVLGARHLDRLTRDLALDFFVLYSSATTIFGNPGQASYVAANRFLEYLAERRRAEGLPALAVAWGPIADVGYLSRNTEVGEALQARLGGQALSARDALATLESLLLDDRSGLAVLDFDWGKLRRVLPAATSRRFVDLEVLADPDDDFGEIDELKDLIADMPDDQAIEVLIDIIRRDVGQILRLEPDRIDANRSVHEFGMDSLMAMELAVAVEKRLGIQLPVMLLGEGPSIARIAERIVSQLRLQPGDDRHASRIEANVRTMAAVHGQAIDDVDALNEVVESLASRDSAAKPQ